MVEFPNEIINYGSQCAVRHSERQALPKPGAARVAGTKVGRPDPQAAAKTRQQPIVLIRTAALPENREYMVHAVSKASTGCSCRGGFVTFTNRSRSLTMLTRQGK